MFPMPFVFGKVQREVKGDKRQHKKEKILLDHGRLLIRFFQK